MDARIARELVESIVDQLNVETLPSKLTSIDACLAGPQRQDLPPTYESHTPGTSKEELEYFSTTLFKDLDQAKKGLDRLLKHLATQKGIVIEVERVIGKLDGVVHWTETPFTDIDIIHSTDVGFQRSNTLPVEIHYGCDIPKDGIWAKEAPLDLEELLTICANLEIRVGGWFLFHDDDNWCYRSNMFEGNAFPDRVKKQYDHLSEHLHRIGRNLGFECAVTALVERSLGVWKTPLVPASLPRVMSDFREPERLARWEERYQNLEHFWVVAGNFLGDLREDVYRAMVQNLSKGVEYTSFLRSFSDVQRLRELAKKLSKEVPYARKYIRAVLVNMDSGAGDVLKGEYFLANPLSPSCQGYELIRSDDRKLRGGRLLKATESSVLTAELSALVDPTHHVQGWPISIQDAERAVVRAVVYTDLKGSTSFQQQFGDSNWERALIAYDLIVSNEVSQLGGEVVKNRGDGYLMVFEQAGDALLCAQRLQTSIHKHNLRIGSDEPYLKIPLHRIALDFGYVTRVIRAQGFDYTGNTLSRCSRLLHFAREDEILMTNTFREHVTAAFPLDWITTRTPPKAKSNSKVWKGSMFCGSLSARTLRTSRLWLLTQLYFFRQLIQSN